MADDSREILRRCPFFTRVEPAGIESLAAIAQWRRFPAAHVIARRDDPPAAMYIVVEGLVRVYQLSPAGKEHVLHLAGPGQTFLEVAVLGGFTSPAFCEASEPSTCLALPATALQGLLRDDHELCLRVLAGMSGWVRHLVGLLEDIVLRDAVGRVTRYLLEIAGQRGPKFELPVLKKHVASHLNLTSETFSRTLRRLTEAELIAMEGGVVRLLDVDGLREAAEGVYPRL